MTQHRHLRMGFWSVLAFVISSQVGSGIFLFPSKMALLGGMGLFGWGITGVGALLLALLFSKLCEIHPETGGPHTYVMHAFGHRVGFYVAWTYWALAWMGMAPVLNILVGSLFLALGIEASPLVFFGVECVVLLGIIGLNLRGVQASGQWEVIMTIMKLVPLILFPLFGLFFIKPHHFVPVEQLPWYHLLSKATLITFWGFIGVESATAPAGSVEKPRTTIPRALIVGTFLVVLLYLMNTTAVIGLVEPLGLSQAACPHGLALNALLGEGGGRWIAALIVIVCLGALNAWCLICSQVAKGAAHDGFFPAIFKKQNRFDAPFAGIFIAGALCTGVLTCLMSHSLADQISFIVDVSVVAYLVIYILCIGAFLKSLWRGEFKEAPFYYWMMGIAALGFCIWPLWGAGVTTILWACVLPLCGVVFDLLWRKKKKV